MTRRYTAELIDFIGPDKDVPAPDMNTNEQTMAWIMDTYSMHARHTVTSVVTGKPVALGGSLGRREATGRGVMFTVNEAIKRYKLTPEKTTVVVQGSGNVGGIGAELMHEPVTRSSRSRTLAERFTTRKASTFPKFSNIGRTTVVRGLYRGRAR